MLLSTDTSTLGGHGGDIDTRMCPPVLKSFLDSFLGRWYGKSVDLAGEYWARNIEANIEESVDITSQVFAAVQMIEIAERKLEDIERDWPHYSARNVDPEVLGDIVKKLLDEEAFPRRPDFYRRMPPNSRS